MLLDIVVSPLGRTLDRRSEVRRHAHLLEHDVERGVAVESLDLAVPHVEKSAQGMLTFAQDGWINVMSRLSRLPKLAAIGLYWDPVLGLHELDIESDSDLVANQNAASLEGSVPGQSEILTIDLCGRRDRNSGVAPWILR